MSILFKSILSLSLSGTLLIVLLFLLKPLFRDRISKRCQYYMWMIVIVRLLVPFTLPASPVNTLFQEVDRSMVKMEIISEEEKTYPLHEGEDTVANIDSFQAKERIPATAATTVLEGLMAMLVKNLWLGWLFGALLLLVRKITIYQSFAKYVKAGCSEVSDIDLLNRLAQYEEQAGVEAPVELYINSHISSPMLIGFFRPCIVLPTVDISEVDLQYTLLHELTHYKHRDMFYKWIVQITLCLHWFNPFVYLMCHEVNQACELACDETIISRLGKKERETYGDMLMNAIGAGGDFRNSIAPITLYENKKMIKERLSAIMNFKKKSIWITLGSLVLVIGLFAVSVAVGAYAAPDFTEGELAENTEASVWGDGQGETDTPMITDNRVSDLADINIIRDRGVYYILSEGVTEIGDHTAGVTDGFIMFVIVREDGYTSVGPFEVTESLVYNVTEQCNYMLGRNSKTISREEANLLIETAAKIQSGDDSGFIDISDWNSRGVDVWAVLVEEYKEWGIEKTDSAYYYYDERVSLLYDLGADGSVRMNYDADGDVNIRLLRDDSGIISKVDYLTSEETLGILNEFHIITAASQKTPANTPDSGADNRETAAALHTDISVANIWERESVAYLAAEDATVIADIIKSGNWSKGTSDCQSDCIWFIGSKEILYHSDCGTFNNMRNEERLHLTEDQQAEVNAILEKYTTLGIMGIIEEEN